MDAISEILSGVRMTGAVFTSTQRVFDSGDEARPRVVRGGADSSLIPDLSGRGFGIIPGCGVPSGHESGLD